MAKHVFNKMESIRPVALTIVGWAAFVVGLVVQPIGLKVMLLSAVSLLP